MNANVVEEFHIGGRVATESFLDQMQIGPDDHVLDVGCGLGGASRFVAERYGARVSFFKTRCASEATASFSAIFIPTCIM